MARMARATRINVRGGWYHVTTRGTERKVIFGDARAYGHFCDLLAEMVERFGVRLHAYVLMPNHAHLVIETPQANLSAAMQWLSTSYSMWFNRRKGRVGPLFQGRYKAILFDSRTEAWPVTRYLHLNPVRIKGLELGKRQSKAEAMGLREAPPEMLARRREALRDHPWSSYPSYAAWRPTPEWLTTEHVLVSGKGARMKARRAAYRTYVESAMGKTLAESPLDQAMAGLLLGSRSWVGRMRRLLKGERLEQKAFRSLETRPDWPQVRRAVEAVKGETWDGFRDRHGDWGRDLALYVARRKCGLSLRSLGGEVGLANYYAVAQAIARMEQRLRKDRLLQEALHEVLERIPSAR
jgi:putative transposase